MLLLYLRNITWGSEYSFESTCTHCDKPFPIEVKVPDDLRLWMLEDTFAEPFPLKLPKSGIELGLRLLRVGDEKAISEYARARQADQQDVLPYRLARSIVTWAGKEANPVDVANKVLDLHAMDTEAIRDEISDQDCGVDLLIDRDCSRCGLANQVRVGFSADFFRSRASSIRNRRRASG
jgi:hypothetical protein